MVAFPKLFLPQALQWLSCLGTQLLASIPSLVFSYNRLPLLPVQPLWLVWKHCGVCSNIFVSLLWAYLVDNRYFKPMWLWRIFISFMLFLYCEYSRSFPSHHSVNAVAMPWYMYFYSLENYSLETRSFVVFFLLTSVCKCSWSMFKLAGGCGDSCLFFVLS